ncbi:MAG: DNA topoisomerase III [Flavobacteriia bacterium]|nr:DNA topoisomerase III [Flavobacteriia bacterium]
MKLCIAEKPSVARDLAKLLGASAKKDGYFEGNGYWVSWTFGHLCTLKEPEDYNPVWKQWRVEDLPIVPESFGIKIISNDGVKKQFEVIKQLVATCEEVINCGDAGQEGELIQRWVLLKAGCKKPVKRLWISSLTDEAIKEGFSKLKNASEFDNLFAAGNSRAIGDWILGINGTRLYTKKFAAPKMILSVGRVQTPTLAMIVQRQKEINAFKSEVYWELKTVYRNTEFLCQIDRLKSEERAQKGLDYLKGKPFEVTSFEQKEGKEGNPRLYDLTSLQVDGNKRYGFSADDTLKHVQNLYEKKLVTYPRVDTTYLSEDLHPKIPATLRGLKDYERFTAQVLSQPIPKTKSIFDNAKVTDHHAIIPTGIQPTGISPDEQKVYDLIARRFIAAFYPECKVSNTTVIGKVDQLNFKATGKQILDKGWRMVYEDLESKSVKKEEAEEKVLPIFTEGESGDHEPMMHQGKTTAPKPYTEATLLRAMETAGKFVENEEMRESMKENGIGRPSTRSAIIETLFKRGYIEKKKKNLIATATGISLIDTIKNDLLKSPELTGQWEHKLRKMERGDYNPQEFKQELFKMVREITDEVLFGN